MAVALVGNKVVNSESNGDKEAGEERDRAASEMTPASIAEAQSMARECISGNYKNCGW